MIHILRSHASAQELNEMQEAISGYIKLAVDIRRGILAGAGMLHADCESALLDDGSRQADIWGADWNPETKEVTYVINIRPQQNNRSLEILYPAI